MSIKSWIRPQFCKWISTAAVGVFLASASPALAAMTFVSVNSNAVSSVDLTDLTKPIIYGGLAGSCTSTDGTNTTTCDSCTGTVATCNKNNIYNDLKVAFQVSTATSGFVVGDAILLNNAGNPQALLTTPVLSTDGTLTVILTWGEICQAISNGNGSGCSASASGSFSIGLKNSTATETIAITVKLRVADAGDANLTFYDDCDDLDTGGKNSGACHFEAARGDEKVYADRLAFSSGYPDSSAATGIPYKDVLLFYESGNPDEAGIDATLMAKITNKSNFATLNASTATAGTVTDNRVTGLSNNTRYCFRMANRDATGVISYWTPADAFLAGQVCTTPTKVVGLLDDKSCFIATAAFGSSMAPEVESFRQFRNQYLMTNPVGKAFVHFYYKHSPYYANLIAESEVAKAAVRAALWPILLFARVALVFGFWITLAFAGLCALGIYEIYRRFFIGRRFRGEL
jgi:hypothetical protein